MGRSSPPQHNTENTGRLSPHGKLIDPGKKIPKKENWFFIGYFAGTAACALVGVVFHVLS